MGLKTRPAPPPHPRAPRPDPPTPPRAPVEWTHVLQLFPTYSHLFRQTQARLVSGNGPLPVLDCHYIALMASSAAGCLALERIQEQIFIRAGGDKAWLAGKVPARLRRLEPVNLVLAHRPSALSPAHIAALLDPSPPAWTLAEAVQAIVILAHYHSLSSLSLGVESTLSGPGPLRAGQYLQLKSRSRVKSGRKLGESADALMLLDERKQWRRAQKELRRKRSFSEGEVTCQAELLLRAQALGATGEPEQGRGGREGGAGAGGQLMVHDFSWGEEGYCTLASYCPDIAPLLDDKFRSARGLSSLGADCEEEEEQFRRAVWHFVQSLFMVQHDDYDYSSLDSQLTGPLREFLEVCCRPPPGPVLQPVLFLLGSRLHHSLKVRVSILMSEARLQSELLFSLQAVMQHMAA